MHQIHFLLHGATPQTPLVELTVPPDPCLYLRGLLLRGWRETGGEEKVKGKEGDRWREGFGPPKKFGVAPLCAGKLRGNVCDGFWAIAARTEFWCHLSSSPRPPATVNISMIGQTIEHLEP